MSSTNGPAPRGGFTGALDAVAVVVLIATALVTWQVHRVVRAHRQTELDYEVKRINSALSERMTAYVQVLRGGVGLFEASDEVTREDWARYVEKLQLAARHPGFKSLSWAPAVTDEELPAFVARVRAEPLPEGLVDEALLRSYRPRPPSDEISPTSLHSPILYVAPFSPPNQVVLGVDMMQEPRRRAAMLEAARSGNAVLSPRLRLAGRIGAEAGFIAYMPVQRAGRLRGWLTAAFTAPQFMSGLSEVTGSTLAFEVLDGPESDAQPLYSTAGLGPDLSPRPLAAVASDLDATSFGGDAGAPLASALPGAACAPVGRAADARAGGAGGAAGLDAAAPGGALGAAVAGAGGRAGRSPPRGRVRGAREERVPGHEEPRDPHAHERRHRHELPAARRAARGRAARAGGDHP